MNPPYPAIGIRLASINKHEKKRGVSLILKEFAFSNLFIICLIILGGFVFIQIAKRQLKDK